MAKKSRAKRKGQPSSSVGTIATPGQAAASKPSTGPTDRSEPPSQAPKGRGQAMASPQAAGAARGAANTGGAPLPAFWFGFAIPWTKLLVFRVLFFGLLAIDCLLQVAHAPRYGAGGFNVPHFSWLAKLATNHVGYELCMLAASAALVMAACGVATRLALAVAAVVYSVAYFGSQLDSYQHHYLMCVVLGISAFINWQRPVPNANANADANANSAGSRPVGGWALRLLLLVIATMYLWAAIAKLEGAWLDGRTLRLQLTGPVAPVANKLGFAVVAVVVMCSEFVLAATVWHKRGWRLALPIGVGLHASILFTGLEIGLFAYLMLAIYPLLLPDRWFYKLDRELLGTPASASKLPTSLVVGTVVACCAGAIAASTMLRFRLGAWVLVGSAGLATAIVIWQYATRKATLTKLALTTPLVIAGLWLAADRGSDTVYDYYRFWGGHESRLGDINKAKRLYGKLIELYPDRDNGYYQLAKLQLQSGLLADNEAALGNLAKAQTLAPKRARAWLLEAKHWAKQGEKAKALAAAQRATQAEPTHGEAAQYWQQLKAGGTPPTGAPAGNEDATRAGPTDD